MSQDSLHTRRFKIKNRFYKTRLGKIIFAEKWNLQNKYCYLIVGLKHNWKYFEDKDYDNAPSRQCTRCPLAQFVPETNNNYEG